MPDERAATYRILSVHVGQPRALSVVTPDGLEHTVVTAICKSPGAAPVRVRLWGLEGDAQADTRVLPRQDPSISPPVPM
jgi:MOSC domain-containing protein YiiM